MMNNLVVVTSLVALASLLSVTHPVAEAGPLHHQRAVASTPAPSVGRRLRAKREIYPEVVEEQSLSPEVCVVGDLVYEPRETVPAEQPCLQCRCQPPGVHCETTRCEKKPGCRAIQKPNTCCPEYQCECDHEGRTYANGERLEQKPGTECKVCYCRGGEVQCAEVSCYMRNDCEGRHVPGKCCPKYEHCPPKEPSNVFFANELLNETQGGRARPAVVHDAEEAHQEITIREIIPEIKEIAITSSPKREVGTAAHHGRGPAVSEDAHGGGNDLHAPDAESDGSEIAAVYEHPPSVLRIGDKLLFLKAGGELVPEKGASTPATVITIIGAEGLQRGGLEPEDAPECERNRTLAVEEEREEPADGDDIQSVAASTHILSLVRRPASTTEAAVRTDFTADAVADGNATEADGVDGLEWAGAANLTDADVDAFTEEAIATEAANATSTSEGASSSDDLHSATEVTTVAASSATVTAAGAAVGGAHDKEPEAESNPEYPPIPDVMTQPADESEPQGKLLAEVGEPARKSAAASEDAEDAPPAATTAATASEEVVAANSTSPASTERSMETMESSEEAGERGASPRHDHASILHDGDGDGDDEVGDASVEVVGAASAASAELVEMLPGFGSVAAEAVTAMATATAKPDVDVEMIDVDMMRGHSADEAAKNATHEGHAKTIGKRESSEDAAIFEELDREIGLGDGSLVEPEAPDGGEEEARQIFQELVAEATSNTTPKPVSLQGTATPQTRAQQQQAAALARIGDALAKLQLRDSKNGGGGLDASVLGILRDFFTAQYRAYN